LKLNTPNGKVNKEGIHWTELGPCGSNMTGDG